MARKAPPKPFRLLEVAHRVVPERWTPVHFEQATICRRAPRTCTVPEGDAGRRPRFQNGIGKTQEGPRSPRYFHSKSSTRSTSPTQLGDPLSGRIQAPPESLDPELTVKDFSSSPRFSGKEAQEQGKDDSPALHDEEPEQEEHHQPVSSEAATEGAGAPEENHSVIPDPSIQDDDQDETPDRNPDHDVHGVRRKVRPTLLYGGNHSDQSATAEDRLDSVLRTSLTKGPTNPSKVNRRRQLLNLLSLSPLAAGERREEGLRARAPPNVSVALASDTCRMTSQESDCPSEIREF